MITAIEPWWPAPDGPTKADLAVDVDVDGLRQDTPADCNTGELQSDWLDDGEFSGVDPEFRDIFGGAKGRLAVSLGVRVELEDVSSSEESDSRLNLCGVLQKNEMFTHCLFQFTFFFLQVASTWYSHKRQQSANDRRQMNVYLGDRTMY